MEKNMLRRCLFGFIIGFNLFIVASMFFPIFVSTSAIQSDASSFSIYSLELIKRICVGEIVDPQIIIFAILSIFIFILSILMIDYSIKRFNNSKKFNKHAYTLSILLFVFILIHTIFAVIITKQPNCNALLGETGSSEYGVCFVQYIYLSVSFLSVLNLKIIQNKKL